MSVTLARLRRDISRRIRSSGTDFQDAFLTAVSDTVQDIIIESVLDVTAFDPDDPATEIDVPEKYYSTLHDGVIWRLMQDKRFNVTAEPVTADRYLYKLSRLKGAELMAQEADREDSDWTWEE